MAAFLVLGFVLVSGWLLMFYSMVYRWTFLEVWIYIFTYGYLVSLGNSGHFWHASLLDL
jgi:hypothetical protein